MSLTQYAYYVSRISDHIGRTPIENYLVCVGVPIARTGWQEYIGREINPNDSETLDSKARVYRHESEVFNPDTVSSFEGKTVVDGHPSEWVTSSNEAQYHKGHIQNVRRGSGADRDYLLADLVIKDSLLANKVENGLREVSCGYFCHYEPIGDSGDMYAQRKIRGNHVAIVPNGRAGDRVAIRDSAENLLTFEKEKKEKERLKEMSDKKHGVTMKLLMGLGLKKYAEDAEPEAIAEAFEVAKKGQEAMGGDGKDALEMPEEVKKEAPIEAPAVEGGGGSKQDAMMGMLERILGVLEQLVTTNKEVVAQAPKAPEPEEQLDEFASAFGGEETPAEEQEEEKLQAGGGAPFRDAEDVPPPLTGEDLPQNPIPGADSAKLVRDCIDAIKPLIASLPDRESKQKAVDSVIGVFKQHRVPGKQTGGYAKLLQLQSARDAKAKENTGDVGSEFGDEIKKKYHRQPASK